MFKARYTAVSFLRSITLDRNHNKRHDVAGPPSSQQQQPQHRVASAAPGALQSRTSFDFPPPLPSSNITTSAPTTTTTTTALSNSSINAAAHRTDGVSESDDGASNSTDGIRPSTAAISNLKPPTRAAPIITAATSNRPNNNNNNNNNTGITDAEPAIKRTENAHSDPQAALSQQQQSQPQQKSSFRDHSPSPLNIASNTSPNKQGRAITFSQTAASDQISHSAQPPLSGSQNHQHSNNNNQQHHHNPVSAITDRKHKNETTKKERQVKAKQFLSSIQLKKLDPPEAEHNAKEHIEEDAAGTSTTTAATIHTSIETGLPTRHRRSDSDQQRQHANRDALAQTLGSKRRSVSPPRHVQSFISGQQQQQLGTSLSSSPPVPPPSLSRRSSSSSGSGGAVRLSSSVGTAENSLPEATHKNISSAKSFLSNIKLEKPPSPISGHNLDSHSSEDNSHHSPPFSAGNHISSSVQTQQSASATALAQPSDSFVTRVDVAIGNSPPRMSALSMLLNALPFSSSHMESDHYESHIARTSVDLPPSEKSARRLLEFDKAAAPALVEPPKSNILPPAPPAPPPLPRYHSRLKHVKDIREAELPSSTSGGVSRNSTPTPSGGTTGKRVFFTTKKSAVPFSVISVLPYKKKKAFNALQEVSDTIGSVLTLKDGHQHKKVSYAYLLQQASSDPYHPDFLENVELRSGRRCQVISLPSVLSTTIPYINQRRLKEDLNRFFREMHPDIPSDMTLSKIRTLKKEALELAFNASQLLDVSTVVLSHIYFEKLVLKLLVRKWNRKLMMATCVLVAVKFNQPNIAFEQLWGELERVFSVNKRRIVENEFTVFSALSFSLMVDLHAFWEHYTRILDSRDLTPETYLGPERYGKTLALITQHQSSASIASPSSASTTHSKQNRES